jgi:hypothetical protein
MHTRDRDYAGWASEQAALLRAGRLAELDIDHIAEELESIMGNERRQLKRRFIILIAHLLKWQFQPDQRGNSWRSTIRIQRDDIADLLAESPSLKREVAEKIQAAYPKARELAADETRLLEQDFPRTCPYSEAELLNPEFWPE